MTMNENENTLLEQMLTQARRLKELSREQEKQKRAKGETTHDENR